jgi:alcohol dehydrogenase
MDRVPGFEQRTIAAVGGGAHRRLGEICGEIHSRRPAILCDAALADSDVLDTIRAQLGKARVVACDPGEPTFTSVLQASRRVADAEPDALIALGGGSTIDTGKLLRGLLAADVSRPDEIPVEAELEVLPYVAVPTTAGTGAEMGAAAVVAHPSTGDKVLVKVPALAADYAIADGWLTTGLPPSLTAFTGADALAQAFLAYVAAGPESVSGQLALRAIDLIFEWLPRVVQDGADREARAQMMLGSATSAIAMFNAPIQFGLEHAIAEPLAGALHLPHGHLVAAVFAGTAEHNLPALEGRYAEVARMLGMDVVDRHCAAAALVERVGRLMQELEVPALRAVVEAQPLEPLADRVLASGALDNSPVPMSRADLVAILAGAWSGEFRVAARVAS